MISSFRKKLFQKMVRSVHFSPDKSMALFVNWLGSRLNRTLAMIGICSRTSILSIRRTCLQRRTV